MKKIFVLHIASMLLVGVLGLTLAAVAVADDSRRGGVERGKWAEKIRAARSNEPVSQEQQPSPVAGSLENDPRAIVKQGKLIKDENGFISLVDIDTRRVSRYLMGSDCRFAYANEAYDPIFRDGGISFEAIPDSSIVKVIVIEGQVQEIILLERPS